MKDTDEQPDEEIQRMRSERVSEQELPSPGVQVHQPSQWIDVVIIWNLSTPHIMGIFLETSPHERHDRLLIPFLAPLPLQRMGSGPEGSKLLMRAWSLWWIEPTCSLPGEHKTFLPPGNSKGFRSSVSDAPITREIGSSLGALCQEMGPKTKC